MLLRKPKRAPRAHATHVALADERIQRDDGMDKLLMSISVERARGAIIEIAQKLAPTARRRAKIHGQFHRIDIAHCHERARLFEIGHDFEELSFALSAGAGDAQNVWRRTAPATLARPFMAREQAGGDLGGDRLRRPY